MSLLKHIKKDVTYVHSSQNTLKLETVLHCPVCIYGDKRRKRIFKNCRSYYFHLKLHENEILDYYENKLLEQEYENLQTLSNQIMGENQNE